MEIKGRVVRSMKLVVNSLDFTSLNIIQLQNFTNVDGNLDNGDSCSQDEDLDNGDGCLDEEDIDIVGGCCFYLKEDLESNDEGGKVVQIGVQTGDSLYDTGYDNSNYREGRPKGYDSSNYTEGQPMLVG
ncbi:hypothetical protein KI387_041703, partial [Taxus chinensis]